MFDNGQATKTVPNEGAWTLTTTDGKVTATFAPQSGFTGPVTQQKYTVTDKNGEKATSTLDVIIRPVANPASTIVDQGQTATLNPTNTPGSAPIISAAFDNGQATKTVPNEGTWTLTTTDGKVTATFAPQSGFTGPVTQQKYTLTDKNGEKATSTLDVTIRPVTKDENVVINPNQVATLNPQTTPGSAPITSVTFSDGSTQKVVPGEGTWSIELVEGKVQSTFTPEKDYHGTVAPQGYVVTDKNGETAAANLSVFINVPPQAGDQTQIIKPNEKATLTPTVTPGNSPITAAVFDNGQTSKTVAGEGTWDLTLVNGVVTAVFTPEKDYDGKVTSQSYAVTDQNGLQATAKLNVLIVHAEIVLKKDYTIVTDVNGNGKNEAGDVVKWTFAVTNTGNVELDNVTVHDDKLAQLGVSVTCPSSVLGAKESMTCESANYTITDADARAGNIHNVATVSGTVPPETPGSPSDPTSPESSVDVPTVVTPAPAALPNTGGVVAWPVIGGGALALVAGAILLAMRRRRAEQR